jgi:hypothetical protein
VIYVMKQQVYNYRELSTGRSVWIMEMYVSLPVKPQTNRNITNVVHDARVESEI